MEPIRLGLLGLGTVGSAVVDILAENADRISAQAGGPIEVHSVLVRNLTTPRSPRAHALQRTTDPTQILTNPDIDIVVAVMGGLSPARTYMLEALQNGKHLVTANKDALANFGAELTKTARDNNVGLYYEAAVAGGIPVIKAVTQALTGNRINALMGIINGTTNYMLDRMTREGIAFDAVLAQAQALGYAEADPTSDVEGHDAAYKLALLAGLAFDAQIDVTTIHREGITNITLEDINNASELGYTIKLLGLARQENGNIEARVHPALIPKTHPLASVHDAFNAIFIEGDAVGELMLYGRGAGGAPTASAVIADIVDAAQNIRRGIAGRLTQPAQPKSLLPISETWSRYYISVQVQEKAGVLAAIATEFARKDVSIESVIQKGYNQDPVSLVFVTHRSQEKNVQSALDAIKKLPTVHRIANILRVEGSP